MEYHFATDGDLDLLAEWNLQLIRDEGHRNRMSVADLRVRMQEWLAGEYKAVVFSADGKPVAYADYRENEHEVYLRQLFVARDVRRRGIGRTAVGILREKVWPAHEAAGGRGLDGESGGREFLAGRRLFGLFAGAGNHAGGKVEAASCRFMP